MTTSLQRWIRFSFLNLLLVSLAGVILRYKIAYALPFVNQKFLLHGHSHFAFSGWVTHTLMVLLIHQLNKTSATDYFKKYRVYLVANLVTAYGMLVSFPLEGYGSIAIIFSTLSILVGYLFAIAYWKDLASSPLRNITKIIFKAALVANVLSSIGPFYLAYMMASQTYDQTNYLSSVYFYLHFQYNGWFLLAILGLAFARIEHITAIRHQLDKIGWLFILTCVPAYLLSVLWLPIPSIIYWLVVLSAFAQLYAWILGIKTVYTHRTSIYPCFPAPGKGLLVLSAIAFSCKLLLQLGSTIPSLSHLSYGFRPIIIGYLHLVLLGFVSLFLIGHIVSDKLIPIHPLLLTGTKIFAAGIILNEVLLMVQGLAALDYQALPHSNGLLLFAALFMFSGILLMNRTKKIQK